MQRSLPMVGVGLLTAFHLACSAPPPPPRVAIPRADDSATIRQTEPVKPLPPQDEAQANLQPGYDDVPLVNQRTPEHTAFVDAYRRVGSPRIAVFVNRTLEGQLLPVNPDEPLASVQYSRRATTGVSVEQSTARDDAFHPGERTSRFSTTGPGEYRESLDVYLRPGQYDDAQASAIDYQALETILTDWISADGQVVVMSPTIVRQRLSDEQVRELQAGRPQVMREVAEQLDADVLVQAQARPTRQTAEGLEVRVIVEAFNIRGGQSIARAMVDVPPPLQKTTLNRYTRFLARKLMDGMIMSWNAPVPEAPTASAPVNAAPSQPPSATPVPPPPPPVPAPPVPAPLPPATNP